MTKSTAKKLFIFGVFVSAKLVQMGKFSDLFSTRTVLGDGKLLEKFIRARSEIIVRNCDYS